MAGKDLLSRLTDAGEEAIQRLSESPGADRLTGVAHAMRDRMDELQKRVRGIDALEKRVAELELRLDELAGAKRTTGTRATRKTPTRTRTKAAATGARSKSSSAKGAAAKAPAAKASTRKASASSRGSTERTGGASPG